MRAGQPGDLPLKDLPFIKLILVLPEPPAAAASPVAPGPPPAAPAASTARLRGGGGGAGGLQPLPTPSSSPSSAPSPPGCPDVERALAWVVNPLSYAWPLAIQCKELSGGSGYVLTLTSARLPDAQALMRLLAAGVPDLATAVVAAAAVQGRGWGGAGGGGCGASAALGGSWEGAGGLRTISCEGGTLALCCGAAGGSIGGRSGGAGGGGGGGPSGKAAGAGARRGRPPPDLPAGTTDEPGGWGRGGGGRGTRRGGSGFGGSCHLRALLTPSPPASPNLPATHPRETPLLCGGGAVPRCPLCCVPVPLATGCSRRHITTLALSCWPPQARALWTSSTQANSTAVTTQGTTRPALPSCPGSRGAPPRLLPRLRHPRSGPRHLHLRHRPVLNRRHPGAPRPHRHGRRASRKLMLSWRRAPFRQTPPLQRHR
jgi:hypothetical protein